MCTLLHRFAERDLAAVHPQPTGFPSARRGTCEPASRHRRPGPRANGVRIRRLSPTTGATHIPVKPLEGGARPRLPAPGPARARGPAALRGPRQRRHPPLPHGPGGPPGAGEARPLALVLAAPGPELNDIERTFRTVKHGAMPRAHLHGHQGADGGRGDRLRAGQGTAGTFILSCVKYLAPRQCVGRESRKSVGRAMHPWMRGLKQPPTFGFEDALRFRDCLQAGTASAYVALVCFGLARRAAVALQMGSWVQLGCSTTVVYHSHRDYQGPAGPAPDWPRRHRRPGSWKWSWCRFR